MSLDDLIKEAYAEPDLDDVIYDTLELDHPAFDAPVRIVCNVEADMTLGGNVHTAVGVSLTLVGFDDDGQTQGQLSIDNVSTLLQPYIQDAIAAGEPITVTYRGYLGSNLATAGEVRGGLFISKVQLNATTATATLEGISKFDSQAFPRLTYDLESYKGLHGV